MYNINFFNLFFEVIILLDIRAYRCKPGTIDKHLKLYKEQGKVPQSRNLGQPLVFAVCETGDPNEYTHIWVYKNASDREKKRNAMQFDPDWVAYRIESAKLGALESQKNKLVNTVDFYDFKDPNS